MEYWNHYAFSIIGCAVICGAIQIFLDDPRQKKLFQLMSGTVLVIVVLRPLSSVDLHPILEAEWIKAPPADSVVEMGKDLARKEQEQYIKEACEAYILEKAEDLGMSISAEIGLDKDLVPAFAKIVTESEAEMQDALELVLEADLGITKENQIWIWNQENSSS